MWRDDWETRPAFAANVMFIRQSSKLTWKEIFEASQQRAEQESSRKLRRLQPEEAAALALLQQRLKCEAKLRLKSVQPTR